MKKSDLPNDIEALKALVLEKDANIHILTERLRLLQALLHAKRSEQKISQKLCENQFSLFDEAEVSADEIQPEESQKEVIAIPEDNTETVVIAEHKRVKKGRRPLDESLPREDVICDIPEEDKICPCGCQLKKIGEEISEKLNIIPQTICVIRTIRPKYACPHCEGTEDTDKTVKIAPMPPHIIPQGIATPSLLAYIALGKFADALPFYRQTKIFERIGVNISRSTMSQWMIHAAKSCKPLIAMLYDHLRAGEIINMDETPVQVLRESERSNTSKSYMWLTCGNLGSDGNPDGGLSDYPSEGSCGDLNGGDFDLSSGQTQQGGQIRLFHYAPSRAGDVARKLLGDFKGFLQTDGYAAYTAIGKEEGITHVGCLVHVRRKFIEVNKGNSKNKQGLATTILNNIAKIYHFEKQFKQKKMTNDAIILARAEKIKPLFNAIYKLMTDAQSKIPPKTLLGMAVKYALGQWERVENYLLNAQLTPDNNIAENAIRPFVIGRKNWLFSGSPRGAESSAILYSLIETAKANKINPQTYLLHVFEKIPFANSKEKMEALLPWNCKEDLTDYT